MKSRGPRSSIFAVLACIASSTAAFGACVDDSNPSGSPDAGPPGLDGSTDVTIGADGGGAEDAGQDAAVDASVPIEDAGDKDAADGSADAADAADATDAADAAPQLDDAGCPLLAAVVADATDAGLPSTGISLWLRADLGVATLDGGVVCRWDDVSGHARGFVPGTTAAPTLDPIGIRGKAGVSFAAPGQYLQRNDVLGLGATSARTVAIYTRCADTTHRFQSFLQGASGSAGTYFGVDTNTFQTAGSLQGVYVTNNGYDSNVATSTSPHSHVLSIGSFAPGGSLPGVLVYSVDGTDTTLTRTPGGLGNGTVEDFSPASTTWLGLGGTGFTGGEIGEVLVYDHALTAPERTVVHQYFQSRFP